MGPKMLLDRWFGRPDREPSPEVARALADLDRLALDRPELTEPARTLGRVLAAAFDGQEIGSISDEDREAMRDCWASGGPSFRDRPPRLDWVRLVARLRRVVDAVGLEFEPARAFAGAIDSKNVDLAGWAGEVLAGRVDEVSKEAAGLGVEPEFAVSSLRMTLLPTLARASAILDQSRPDGAWMRGDCPHCGSRPLLAESRGLEQRIHYRCGLCAADWPGERLRCPSCGEADSKALHRSFVEGEQDRCRLGHCEACLYDWKVVSTLTPLSPPAMIVADLATVHLDLLAADGRGGSP